MFRALRVLAVQPRGGVQAGEQFVGTVDYLDGSTGFGEGVPVGHWRHSLCDCCVNGIFHPLWIMAFFYTSLPLAQVQTRLQLTFCGHEKHSSSVHGPSAFRVAMMLFVGWLASVRGLEALFKLIAPDVPSLTMHSAAQRPVGTHSAAATMSASSLGFWYDVLVVLFLVGVSVWYRCFLDQPRHFRFILGFLFVVTITVDSITFLMGFVGGVDDSLSQSSSANPSEAKYESVDVPAMAQLVGVLHLFLLWGMRLFIVYAGTRTRSFLRQKYAIPGADCADCCWMWWCPCCTVIQMSTHTADYRGQQHFNYGAENGLDDDLEAAVVPNQLRMVGM